MELKNRAIRDWLESGEKTPMVFPLTDLEDLLNSLEILQESDTLLCDRIRILRVREIFLIQEVNWKKEAVLHRMADFGAAKAKVKARLAIYERMWDGCGCKVDHLT